MRVRPDPVLESVKNEAVRVFKLQVAQEPGSWEHRTRQSVRGRVVNQTLIEELDRALTEEWTALPSSGQTLWSLNSLLYAGKEM